jgi:DNA-binding transcriptional ArsR family regulator
MVFAGLLPLYLSMAPSATELSSAIGHPLRRRILLAYLDGELERAAAGEAAAALGERVGQVAYHLKMLATVGVLKLTEGASGGEPLYGFAPGIDPAWLRLVLQLSAESSVRG